MRLIIPTRLSVEEAQWLYLEHKHDPAAANIVQKLERGLKKVNKLPEEEDKWEMPGVVMKADG